MKGNKKALIYFGLSGLIVLAGGALCFSLLNGISEKGLQLKHLKAEARKPEDLQKELEDAKYAAEQSGIELAHLEKNIPEVAYVPTMLKELEQFGKKSGVNVYGVRPFVTVDSSKKEKKKKVKPYSELSIEIKGKGKYRAVMNFVDAMKSFPKIVAVRTVALTPKATSADVKGYGNLDVTLELRAYLFKPASGEDLGYPKVDINPETQQQGQKQGGQNGAPAVPTVAGKAVDTLSKAKEGSL